MRITMRVHTLTLERFGTTPMATLYRHDHVKDTKARGWADRLVIPADGLDLGDIVEVTINRAGER